MGLLIGIEAKLDYLHVTARGSFELKQAQQLFQRVVDSCIGYQLPKVLVDCNGVKGTTGTLDKFSFSIFGADRMLQVLASGQLPAMRIAFVGNIKELDPGRFGETVALNRGAAVKESDTFEEAFEWLDVERQCASFGVGK